MRTRTCLLIVLASLLIGGCSAGDPPVFDGRPLSVSDNDRLYKARLLVLNDGQTTRADVLSVMGDPDRITDDKRTVMYYWTSKDKESDQIVRSFVIAQFGLNDVLVKHLVKAYSRPFGGPKLPEEALSEFLNPPLTGK